VCTWNLGVGLPIYMYYIGIHICILSFCCISRIPLDFRTHNCIFQSIANAHPHSTSPKKKHNKVHTQAVEAAGSGKWKMENRSRVPGRKGSPNAVEATTIVHLNAVWGPRARQHISLGAKNKTMPKQKTIQENGVAHIKMSTHSDPPKGKLWFFEFLEFAAAKTCGKCGLKWGISPYTEIGNKLEVSWEI